MNRLLFQKFGEFVFSKRKQLGWSQEELAFQSELSTNYIRRIEKGLVNPSLATISKISQALDIKTSELISIINTR